MLGQLLDERYKVVRILGSGGFGQTFVAEDTKRPGNPVCVVKKLKPASSDSGFLETARRLFRSEAETLENLGNHPQIPRLLAYFEQNREFYLVQEYIEGQPLSAELRPGEKWTENQVINLLKDVLGILAFVHQNGVIHRDIKPDNIIRRRVDNHLVLIDFGAVKQVRSQTNTGQNLENATIAIGTPGYMPSEQGIGKPKFSSDIYALGVIAIQALSGLNPAPDRENTDTGFRYDQNTGEIIWQDKVQVSPSFAAILTKMLKPHFPDRYAEASEALQALAQLHSSYTPTGLANPMAKDYEDHVPKPSSTQGFTINVNKSPDPSAPETKSTAPSDILILAGAFLLSVVIGVILYLTSTPQPRPSPLPTDTPSPLPTDTPSPSPTDTPSPSPTDTPSPSPTDTPLTSPTDTPLTPSPTDTPLTPSPTKIEDNPKEIGSVAAWQNILNGCGYPKNDLPLKITGEMDQATISATKDFQKIVGLPITGTVDLNTWKAGLEHDKLPGWSNITPELQNK